MFDMSFTKQLERHKNDRFVAFAGDWHGNSSWGAEVISRAGYNGASLILHVGDFGIMGEGSTKRYLNNLEKAANLHDVDLWVTGGNHENWDYLNTKWKNSKRRDENDNPLPLQLSSRVWFLPRPYFFSLSGVKFLSSGGAASVDFDRRTLNKTWWPSEMISDEEVKLASAQGRVDVLITHESSNADYATKKVSSILHTNPFGFSEEGLKYSAKSRAQIDKIVEATLPRLHVHGHFHTHDHRVMKYEGSDRELTVWSLDREGTFGNLLFMKLPKLERIKTRVS